MKEINTILFEIVYCTACTTAFLWLSDKAYEILRELVWKLTRK